MAKLKIAYLMHVDWNWIKQRPHFIYEELTNYFDVDLFYINKFYDSSNNVDNLVTFNKLHKKNIIRKLPYSSRVKSIKRIENFLNYYKFDDLELYDFVWITSPLILEYLPVDKLKGKFIVYDCMDDFPQFYPIRSTKQVNAERLESELIGISGMIIVSSAYLRNKICSKYRDQLKVEPLIINNGVCKEWIENSNNINTLPVKDHINIMYIGTIGDWFDFSSIHTILREFSNIRISLVGPVDTKNIEQHPRLRYFGSVDHRLLPLYANEADAFIMPFKINELVRSVDPVKIYEYISFRKPVISISYKEIEKFYGFVELYSNQEELITLVHKLNESEILIPSFHEIEQFLMQHTWDKRVVKIVEELFSNSY